MSATKSLGTLCSDSVTFIKKHLTALLVGAVVFGVATNGIGWWLAGSAAMQGVNFGAWQQQLEGASKRMEELQQKAVQGGLDAASQKEMEVLGKQMMEQSLQGVGAMSTVLKAMLPAIGLSLLLTIVVALIAKSYFLVIAVKGMTDAGAAAQGTVGAIVPLVGLWLWIAIRTFVWIPVLGFFIAIVVGPRFLLSPLYLLEQKKGVMESARMSYGKTKGFWGKIIGNVFVFALVTMICAAILGKLAVGVLGLMLGGFVAAIIGELASAFIMIFAMQLARTVIGSARA